MTIASRGALLSTEIWQFAGMLAFFGIALFLWLRIVYLPGRTLERWEDRRIEEREEYRPTKGFAPRGCDS